MASPGCPLEEDDRLDGHCHIQMVVDDQNHQEAVDALGRRARCFFAGWALLFEQLRVL